MIKRKGKKGFVYILMNQEGTLFKYGASIDPQTRVRHINYDFKQNKFDIIHLMPSKDIFRLENKIKHFMLRFGVFSEIFGDPIFTKDMVLKIANCAFYDDKKSFEEIYYQVV
ncbi:hypothetical protein UFOVP1155_4 [uncultured Caudovirales phage]|uniref:Bacteriophage T5 Orf172 DNA-binding domain-containing protein n=1 Tax=uncultured Caudovirales phage TaxID=2100421 RepID=A0A6J5QRA1_9CAUD|nr:hypothetical protein UFOVP1155_4 [uncultured Caudovirales phage]